MSDLALSLPQIESPCISICRLDEHRVCIGCFRTADEIASWMQLSPSERRDIMDDLPARAARSFETG